jgi:hypothetical protein
MQPENSKNASGSESVTTSESQAFRTMGVPIEFSFPPDWHRIENGHPYDLQCVAANNRMVTNVFVYDRRELATTSTASSVLSRQIDDLKSRRSNFTMLNDLENYRHEERNFTTVTYTGDTNAESDCYRITLVEFDALQNYFAIVLQTGLPEEWLETEPILDQIARSATPLLNLRTTEQDAAQNPGNR